jgi:ribosomal protein S18 acetylase RimI-like enzyme
MMLKYSNIIPDIDVVEKFLFETKDEFNIPLDQVVDIKLYALKLHKDSEFFLCYNDDNIVAMINCYMNRIPEGYISNVCVKNEYRHKGILRNLFSELLKTARNKGIKIITLEVNNKNINAFNAYIKLGFFLKSINENSSYLFYKL